MSNCISFNFNDPEDLEKKIVKCDKDGGVYCVIVEPYSASLLESCSEEFMKSLIDLKNKYKFKVIFDEVFTGFLNLKTCFIFRHLKM